MQRLVEGVDQALDGGQARLVRVHHDGGRVGEEERGLRRGQVGRVLPAKLQRRQRVAGQVEGQPHAHDAAGRGQEAGLADGNRAAQRDLGVEEGGRRRGGREREGGCGENYRVRRRRGQFQDC